MERGLIVIGYQGIGKSTLANKRSGYIDLESGNFMVDGRRDNDWYKVYAKIAIHLSEQGYIVFVSSHKAVRDELNGCGVPVGACYPSISLKDEWIKKLQQRYDKSGLLKDYRALMNAKERFVKNITEIIEDCDRYSFKKFEIRNVDYTLIDIVSPKSERHDLECVLEFPHCPCNTCRNASSFCCLKHHLTCVSKHCRDYIQEDDDETD